MIKNNDITLEINNHSWWLFTKRRDDVVFEKIADKIFKRDKYTCSFCSFRALLYQEVINIDGNYRNNSLSNLVTSCRFCAQCFFLDALGNNLGFGGGRFIYLPEIKQIHLNSFCHVLFCAMSNTTNYSDYAKITYRQFKFRSKIVENKFGKNSSHPNILSHMLAEIKIDRNLKLLSREIFKNIRVLPSFVAFKKELNDWMKRSV